VRIFSQYMNQILALIISLHDHITLLSPTPILLRINYIEQLDYLSLTYIIHDHLHLIIARLNKQLLQLCQVVFE